MSLSSRITPQAILFTAILLTASSLVRSQTCRNANGGSTPRIGVCNWIEQCQGAALTPPPGNCTTGQICCIAENALNIAANQVLTKAIFLRLVSDTPRNNFLYDYIVQSMQLAGVSVGTGQARDSFKIAAYLSQIVGESDYFKKLESNVLNDPDNDPLLGNNQTGDGRFFQGRGAILVRGRENYEIANKSTSLS